MTIKQVVFRITLIIAATEFIIMLLFAYVMTHLSPLLETFIDTVILVTVVTPVIYFYIIKPYVNANEKLLNYIQDMAMHDDLTHLWNRRALQNNLKRICLQTARHNNCGAVLYFDLDNFKDINDHFGHEAGDEVLVELARRFLLCVREEDTVYRVGGDEFVVVLEMLHSDESLAVQKALNTAERILEATEKPIDFRGAKLRVGVSIGLRLIVSSNSSVEDILKEADSAMYDAKRLTEKRIVVFNHVL